MRFVNSGSFFRLRFRFLASHSGKGRAVDEPEMVYTGTAEWFVSFIARSELVSALCPSRIAKQAPSRPPCYPAKSSEGGRTNMNIMNIMNIDILSLNISGKGFQDIR